jgi:hypothetical protein
LGVDAVDVSGSLLQASSGAARHEETDSKIVFDGAWTPLNNTNLSAGRYVSSTEASAVVNLTFKGTRFDWYTLKNADCGQVRVYFDGVATATVDLYSPTLQWQTRVWRAQDLEDTTHTVRLEVMRAKTGASSGYNVGFDAADIVGSLAQATSSVPPVVRYEQNDPLISYVGTWSPVSGGKFSSGAYFTTNATGSASFAFNGTGVSWITLKGPDCGIGTISVDGGVPIPADLYSATYTYNTTVWMNNSLAPGRHTVTIRWTGTKGASSNTFVGVDAIDIRGGTLVP